MLNKFTLIFCLHTFRSKESFLSFCSSLTSVAPSCSPTFQWQNFIIGGAAGGRSNHFEAREEVALYLFVTCNARCKFFGSCLVYFECDFSVDSFYGQLTCAKNISRRLCDFFLYISNSAIYCSLFMALPLIFTKALISTQISDRRAVANKCISLNSKINRS